MVSPFPATLVADVGLSVPVLAGSSSTRMGSPVEALAEGSSLGGVVDGGGMSGTTSSGPPCCRPSPTNPVMSITKIVSPMLASGK